MLLCISSRLRVGIYTTVLVVLLGSGAVMADGKLCWRGRPSPRCEQFVITEFDACVLSTLSANFGYMRNTGPASARGGLCIVRADVDGPRLGAAFRYRRWLTSRIGLDVTPAVFVLGTDEGSDAYFPSASLAAGIIYYDLVGATLELEVFRSGDLMEVGGPLKGYVGVRTGSFAAVSAGAVAVVAAFIVVVVVPFLFQSM